MVPLCVGNSVDHVVTLLPSTVPGETGSHMNASSGSSPRCSLWETYGRDGKMHKIPPELVYFWDLELRMGPRPKCCEIFFRGTSSMSPGPWRIISFSPVSCCYGAVGLALLVWRFRLPPWHRCCRPALALGLCFHGLRAANQADIMLMSLSSRTRLVNLIRSRVL